MLFYFLIFFPVGLIGICAWLSWRKQDPSYLGVAVVLSLIFLLLGGVIGSTVISGVIEPTKVGVCERPIASLWSGDEYSGRFFLGSGQIDKGSVYYFMFDLGEGRYKRGWTWTSDTILQESSEKPCFAYDIYKIRRWWLAPFDMLPPDFARNFRLVVPKGTIVKEFADR